MTRKVASAFVVLPVAILAFGFLAAKDKKDSFNVAGFVGTSSTAAAPGRNVVLLDKETKKPVDSVSTNFLGRYKFKEVKPGTYIVKCEKVEREVTVVSKDIRMDIDLSAEGGAMDYGKAGKEELAAAASGAVSGQAAPPGPSDPELQRTMAGEYYSYSGSTERKLMLCSNGAFFDSRESSYSGSFGTGQGGWGQASASGGSGSYSIQGSEQQGTIHFSYKSGKRLVSQYRSTGERGCYSFDGQTFCYSGGERCK
ncbi:MAG: carboxypeptidase-like regulatory domain-containing protein [Deltaproteobacteria bacterium]